MNTLRILFFSVFLFVLSGFKIVAQDLSVFEFQAGVLYNPSLYANSPLNTGLNVSLAYSIDRKWLAGIDLGACNPRADVAVSAQELGSGILWSGESAELREHLFKSWGGFYIMHRFLPLSPVNISLFAQGSVMYTARRLEKTDLLNADFYSWYDSNYGPRSSFCVGGGMVLDFQVSKKSALRLTLADRDVSAMMFRGYDDRMFSRIYYAEKRSTRIERSATQMNSREVSLGVVFRIGQKKL